MRIEISFSKILKWLINWPAIRLTWINPVVSLKLKNFKTKIDIIWFWIKLIDLGWLDDINDPS